jgi:hypothetical protein
VVGSSTVGGVKRLESVYYGSIAADKDDVNLVQSLCPDDLSRTRESFAPPVNRDSSSVQRPCELDRLTCIDSEKDSRTWASAVVGSAEPRSPCKTFYITSLRGIIQRRGIRK